MDCQGISNRSNCCKLGIAVGIASLCTLMVIGVIFRNQIPSIARKFGSLYTNAPLKIQLPLVAASAAIATFLLGSSTYLCYQKMQTQLPDIISQPGSEDRFE